MADKEEKEEGENIIRKALSCYEVQRTIMRYLSLSDLKSLRLVNKEWMDSAMISLKQKSLIILDSRESVQNYNDFLQASSICFSNYFISIKQDKFESCREAVNFFREFWAFCSNSVVDLTISIPWICAYQMLHSIFTETVAIRLEKLTLNLRDVEIGNEKWSENELEENMEEDQEHYKVNESKQAEEANESSSHHQPAIIKSFISLTLNVSIVLKSEKKVFPFTWTEFFLKCPNLCHLSIQSDYGSGHFYRIFNVLVERKMSLKSLKIGTRDQRLFSEEFLKKIGQLITNETTTLSLGFLPSVNHDSPLGSILCQSSLSLRHLTFLQIRTANQGRLACFASSDSTYFPNLDTLRITKELIPNLSCLVKMPRIKRLEIFRDSTIGQHDALSNPVINTRSLPVFNGLQSLVLEPFVPEEAVWRLVRWFPNLQRLQLKANDVIARIVFMSWKDLKELYLTSEINRDNNDIVRSSLTDEGITGFSKEFLQEQNLEGGHSSLPARTVAFIGNLEKLETCKLQAFPDYLTGITDFSIIFGLMNLPALKSLTLVKTLITPAGAERLRSRGVSVTLNKL